MLERKELVQGKTYFYLRDNTVHRGELIHCSFTIKEIGLYCIFKGVGVGVHQKFVFDDKEVAYNVCSEMGA